MAPGVYASGELKEKDLAASAARRSDETTEADYKSSSSRSGRIGYGQPAEDLRLLLQAEPAAEGSVAAMVSRQRQAC